MTPTKTRRLPRYEGSSRHRPRSVRPRAPGQTPRRDGPTRRRQSASGRSPRTKVGEDRDVLPLLSEIDGREEDAALPLAPGTLVWEGGKTLVVREDGELEEVPQ